MPSKPLITENLAGNCRSRGTSQCFACFGHSHDSSQNPVIFAHLCFPMGAGCGCTTVSSLVAALCIALWDVTPRVLLGEGLHKSVLFPLPWSMDLCSGG